MTLPNFDQRAGSAPIDIPKSSTAATVKWSHHGRALVPVSAPIQSKWQHKQFLLERPTKVRSLSAGELNSHDMIFQMDEDLIHQVHKIAIDSPEQGTPEALTLQRTTPGLRNTEVNAQLLERLQQCESHYPSRPAPVLRKHATTCSMELLPELPPAVDRHKAAYFRRINIQDGGLLVTTGRSIFKPT